MKVNFLSNDCTLHVSPPLCLQNFPKTSALRHKEVFFGNFQFAIQKAKRATLERIREGIFLVSKIITCLWVPFVTDNLAETPKVHKSNFIKT